MIAFRTHMTLAAAAASCIAGAACASAPNTAELQLAKRWVESRFEGKVAIQREQGLLVLANNDPVQRNERNGAPMKIGETQYTRGLFCHANSKVVVKLPSPGATFTSVVGVDAAAPPGTVVFSVVLNGQPAFKSPLMKGSTSALPVKVDLKGATEFTLEVGDGGDNIAWDQSDWADAKVTLADGKVIWLGDMPFLGSWGSTETSDAFFSFDLDGKPSSSFISKWKLTRRKRSLDANRMEHVLTYTDPSTGLQARTVGIRYHDYPTVEWTLYLKNTGTKDTPIISNIRSLDMGLQRDTGSEYALHLNKGAESGVEDYRPLTMELKQPLTTIAASNGRPTEAYAPYFNIDWSGQGLIMVLGWPGQWSAQFMRDSSTGLRICAGQELTNLKLHPGEEIRTPLVVLQFWSGGDWIRAQNVWRRWMVAHSLPRPGGKLPPNHLAACSSHQYAEMQNATSENQKMFIDRYLEEKLPLDYWWMDAGWYTNYGSWMNTGTWDVDLKRFPGGLRSISDHAHAKGVKTIVWFEPECVTPSTWLADNHPDWVLGPKDWTKMGHDNAGAWCLLNLGNPDARKWLTNMLDTTINEQGIDLYRQDFRLGPIGAWRANDTKERQGITEIRHCEGYLANWDELRRLHPNMLIDSCAAGGRRNELEAMRRAVPLLRSDYILEPVGNQCHTYGISLWLPLYGTAVNCSDAYGFRSVMTPMLNACYDMRNPNLDYNSIRKLMGQWKSVSEYMLGDYYPLTPYTTERHLWIAWQFDKPETGDGMVQAFRRDQSYYTSTAFCLRGLEPDASYTVTDLDTNGTSVHTGKELMEKGLDITIAAKPGSALIVYKKN
ncbi:MAG: NPCBM/NEW2 domain-containing protein [Armatimonadota bacterium]